jgi:methionine-rich copper-binding protein CopC
MTPTRIRRTVAALVLTVLLTGLVPATVLGHAELATISPADGTTVTVAPTQIAITFTEPLDPKKSSIVLVPIGDSPILTGGVVDSADAKRMTLAVPGLASGAYEVRWTSASVLDGDLDRGVTNFTYSPPASSPTDENGSPPSATPSTAPPSVAPSQTPNAVGSNPGTPLTASSNDPLIPIFVALILLVALGLWLLRGRSRGAR